MSPVREMKDGRGKCIFYGSLPQETGGLTPMHLLFYFPYKNCKNSLISIYFIAPVYELFDNLSYSELITFFSGEILVYFY